MRADGLTARGVCPRADPMHQLPNQSGGEMDSETFMMMGFMVLPMLFIMFGLMQRMQGRRRELPAPPVNHAAEESMLRALPVLVHSKWPTPVASL